jgi:hypothetical protein
LVGTAHTQLFSLFLLSSPIVSFLVDTPHPLSFRYHHCHQGNDVNRQTGILYVSKHSRCPVFINSTLSTPSTVLSLPNQSQLIINIRRRESTHERAGLIILLFLESIKLVSPLEGYTKRGQKMNPKQATLNEKNILKKCFEVPASVQPSIICICIAASIFIPER